ncbi:MAG: hypothetical protein A2X61_03640 [Ignavibacteria bacterium GWB2_35_12]|nr:MAG: hypothetical protein A2X63_00795 [Ignavibacteria bacterium GWA2_35_8]OGU40378.1 MAG: hypothetical protein A2X61_03640 [Ignavibacteria bacterium GWB2_35_12]OGU92171.1 MAG: hypothetical protein A2220_13580 [Ignavibacteria bacterium RIFOXYA2_FULL_35_10]OGV22514.1 MAG: hypothetical protein A2475_03315 [Ignavibacteria bacterium RIFOXYC2_FULL_35_21]
MCRYRSSNYIFAGNYGGGVFRAKLSDLLTDVNTEEKVNEAFKVSPNPVTDKLNVQLNDELNTKFEIINILGLKVLTGELSGEYTTINISQLPSGMYFMKIRNEVRKFVKE